MCRFTFYTGTEITVADLVTRPEHSLIRQSTHARERTEPLNGDGFGLAWYLPEDPCPARFRSISPAWNDANLAELARVTRSRCILAHVRAASSGRFSVAEDNCHPFRCGPFTLMHNGHITAFERIRRPLIDSLSDAGFADIAGNTDTEHIFALALEGLRGHEGDSSCERLADALEHAITVVLGLIAEHAPGNHAYLNLLLADGRSSVACRFSTDPDHLDSLYINQGSHYRCEDGVCRMSAPARTGRAVLISSEPLNEGPRWQSLGRNQMALVDADLAVRSRPLAATA